MTKNCPSCALREKAESSWDTNGGDFWWCTAKPIVPEFCGAFVSGRLKGRIGGPINLKLFEAGTTYHDGLQRDCPLWADRG